MLNLEQQTMDENLTHNRGQNPFRKSDRKAPGTRLGIKIDWRESSAGSGKQSGCYGRSLRNGR
jgi:hypothetical protein